MHTEQIASEHSPSSASGSRKAEARAVDLAAQLYDVRELLYNAIVVPPLPAMLHVGSLAAARAIAAESLERLAAALLSEARGRQDKGRDETGPLQNSQLGLYWARRAHSKLEHEEVARLVLLQVGCGAG